MWPNPQETLDLVTFTEEILDVKILYCFAKCYEDFTYDGGFLQK